MTFRVLQHAPSEGPGDIAAWLVERGHAFQVHHLDHGDPLPDLGTFDVLVVLGGEMNVYKYRDYPWLKAERELIATAMASGKRVVGICLGAQLIADALGFRVTQNPLYEVGWFPVRFSRAARDVFPKLPDTATVLHWHGDTFELPAGAIRLGSSDGCPEQGFVMERKCLGLQFHLEMDPELVSEGVRGTSRWPRGPFVQSPQGILDGATAYRVQNRALLHHLLDTFCAPEFS